MIGNSPEIALFSERKAGCYNSNDHHILNNALKTGSYPMLMHPSVMHHGLAD